MSQRTAQDRLDELAATSAQQWGLRTVIVAAPVGAVLTTAGITGDLWGFGAVMMAVLGVIIGLRPDTHVAAAVIGMTAWHWVVAVDDVTTPWVPVTATLLLVFHVAVALASSLPVGGRLPGAVWRRWALRTGAVTAGTVAVWLVVVLMERRDAPGNGLLTGVALVLIAAAAVLIRARSLPRPD